MNQTISSSNRVKSSPEYTWKEHHRLFTKSLLSWRYLVIIFGISILLIFTAGIVFQTIFVFSILRVFHVLALVNQTAYSTYLYLSKNSRLPLLLPKPPNRIIIWCIFQLLISIFFLYIGIYVFKMTGFCPQSLGCIITTMIRLY